MNHGPREVSRTGGWRLPLPGCLPYTALWQRLSISLEGVTADMAVFTTYKTGLAPQPRLLRYRQWFVQGGAFQAEVLYRATLAPKPRTPEEVAQDYNVP